MRVIAKVSTALPITLGLLFALQGASASVPSGFSASGLPTSSNIAVAAVAASLPPALRANASIVGQQIHLGDLFDNAGDHAQEVVATAPAPGTSQIFESDWLTNIAKRHGLDWTPPNSFVQIRVDRASTLVSREMIEQALAAKLAPNQSDRQVKLESMPKLYADANVGDPALAVQDVNIDPSSGRFTAAIRIASEAGGEAVRVTGRIDSVVQMPTLSHPMMPGEIIQRGDIAWVSTRVDLLAGGSISDSETLIGRSPRRPLHANQFLRAIDVEQPTLVKRNELVMIVLEEPGMFLTAEGKALESGGKGEVIRVTNVQSNRAIDAVVLGSGRVGVVAPGMQAMN